MRQFISYDTLVETMQFHCKTSVS